MSVQREQQKTAVIAGGSEGIGFAIASHYAALGWNVLLTSRDSDRAGTAAERVGHGAVGRSMDVRDPASVRDALGVLDVIDRLVMCAVVRDHNSIGQFDPVSATDNVTIKMIGSLNVVSAAAGRLPHDGSILLLGGAAKDRPHEGSTTMTPVCAAVAGIVRALCVELAPIRVNGLHPGAIGDSARWQRRPEAERELMRSQTLTRRLATMSDIVGAAAFLLENQSLNAVNLTVDGGWLLETIVS